MDEQLHARALIQQLSEIEKDALAGLVNGEPLADLAKRWSLSMATAAEVREAMRCQLGVQKDAEAVRIGLIAERSWDTTP